MKFKQGDIFHRTDGVRIVIKDLDDGVLGEHRVLVEQPSSPSYYSRWGFNSLLNLIRSSEWKYIPFGKRKPLALPAWW